MKYILTIILALVASVGISQTRMEVVAGKTYSKQTGQWSQTVELSGYLELHPGQITLNIRDIASFTRQVVVTRSSTTTNDGYTFFTFRDEVGVNYAVVITPEETLELWVESSSGKSKFLLSYGESDDTSS